MKMPRTNAAEIIIKDGDKDERFVVSKAQAKGLVVFLNNYRAGAPKDDNEWVDAEEVFKDLDAKYTRPGAILRGARLKENLTQTELAKRLGITQGDLSKMEWGKRPISVKMAKRLGKILNIGYQVFL